MVLVSNDDGGRTLLSFILASAVMSPPVCLVRIRSALWAKLLQTPPYLKIHTHLVLSNEQLLVKPEITCYVAVCLPRCLICILNVPREEEKKCQQRLHSNIIH